MKRSLYIGLFMVLGLLVSFLVHAGIEIFYINLLLKDFPRYGFGLGWDQWLLVHNVGSVVLSALGLWLGYRQGRYWWLVIYRFGGR